MSVGRLTPNSRAGDHVFSTHGFAGVLDILTGIKVQAGGCPVGKIALRKAQRVGVFAVWEVIAWDAAQ